jgi:hypothetical protein
MALAVLSFAFTVCRMVHRNEKGHAAPMTRNADLQAWLKRLNPSLSSKHYWCL